MQSLVQPLFDGPIDLVGDIHGEIEALTELLRHLGYAKDGLHLEKRRLVFLGDLTDRGPDSPAVVSLVQSLVQAGRAQCVLGNHDLNILLGLHKPDNPWFFGKEFRTKDGSLVPQVWADDATRQIILSFFHTLPLALERDGLRVVHAYWDQGMIDVARSAPCSVVLHEQYRHNIDHDHSQRSDLDETDRRLEHQNLNPLKLLTSGPERRSATPKDIGGRRRFEERVEWWSDYSDPQLCVFGHYSLPSNVRREGRAICVDFGVGKRSLERLGHSWAAKTRLGALRVPEMQFVFDDGQREAIGEVQPHMTSNWNIDSAVIAKVQAFFEEQRSSPVVKRRTERNLSKDKPPITKDVFWKWMVACRLTSQQPSGPESAVCNFIRCEPFQLAFGICRDRPDLATFAEEVLAAFGGLRFSTKIGKDIDANMAFLQSGGWELVSEQLENVRLHSNPSTERCAAAFLDKHLKGFGPKQSRNVLQCLGLSEYEVPLDSRTGRWLVDFGFPALETQKLQNHKYYNLISDNYQRLCEACGIKPCVLDAAIFASFDKDGWTEDNLVW